MILLNLFDFVANNCFVLLSQLLHGLFLKIIRALMILWYSVLFAENIFAVAFKTSYSNCLLASPTFFEVDLFYLYLIFQLSFIIYLSQYFFSLFLFVILLNFDISFNITYSTWSKTLRTKGWHKT